MFTAGHGACLSCAKTLNESKVKDVIELADMTEMEVKKKSGLPFGEVRRLVGAAKEEKARREAVKKKEATAKADAARAASELAALLSVDVDRISVACGPTELVPTPLAPPRAEDEIEEAQEGAESEGTSVWSEDERLLARRAEEAQTPLPPSEAASRRGRGSSSHGGSRGRAHLPHPRASHGRCWR